MDKFVQIYKARIYIICKETFNFKRIIVVVPLTTSQRSEIEGWADQH